MYYLSDIKKWYNTLDFHAPVHMLFVSLIHVIVFYSNPNSFWDLGFEKNDEIYLSVLSLLIHVDSSHLWNNLSLQIPFGFLFEMLHSHLPCALIFWMSGLFGALLEIKFLKENVVYGGASAGDFALVAAFLSHLIMNWKEAKIKYIALFLLILYIGLTLVTAVVEQNRNVAHLAHLGGFLHGLVLGNAVVKNYKVYRWERVVHIISSLLSVLIFLIFLI